MTIRSRSLATGLLVLNLAGWLWLLAVDTSNGSAPAAPSIVSRGLTFGALSTFTLLSAGWIAVLVIRSQLDRHAAAVADLKMHMDRRFDSLGNGQVEQDARREGDTAEIKFLIAGVPAFPAVAAVAAVPAIYQGGQYTPSGHGREGGGGRRSRRRRTSTRRPTSDSPTTSTDPADGADESVLVDKELRAYFAGLAEAELRREGGDGPSVA